MRYFNVPWVKTQGYNMGRSDGSPSQKFVVRLARPIFQGWILIRPNEEKVLME
jgi:hypothetical protein